MTKHSRTRLKCLLVIMVFLLAITSLMAQDAPLETPIETPVATLEATTDVSVDVAAPIPTAEVTLAETMPEIIIIPTEVAPEVTPIPSVTVVGVEESPILTPELKAALAPEPLLTLVTRDLFEEGALPVHWAFPIGWTLVKTADSGAVKINPASAGLSSRASLNKEYANAAVMGYFTFLDISGAAQVIVRESASGAYIATLNANGIVTLEKRDASGTSSVLSTAAAAVQAGAHSLRLSVIGDVLRVSVDNTEVIALQDSLPLPAGRISMGAVFPVNSAGSVSGTILFDNAFVWQPTSEVVVAVATAAPTTVVTPEVIVEAKDVNAKQNAANAKAAKPPVPVLSTTTPAELTNDTTPDFSWTVVSAGAIVINYELQLSTVSTFDTLVGGSAAMINGSTTTYAWTPPLPATTAQIYYARIRSLTNQGKSKWSDVRSFTLDTVAPVLAPVLLAPADNSIVTTQTPTFEWEAVAEAARYEIRYGTSSDLSAVPPISVLGLTYTPTDDLTEPLYYWQVRALDAAENTGPWSDPRLVKIGFAPFVWNTADNTPTLTWTAIQWADTYHIQVSRNSTFTDIVWEDAAVGVSATPAATIGVILPNGVYYWHVRARTQAFSGGQYGEFSDGSSFRVEAP